MQSASTSQAVNPHVGPTLLHQRKPSSGGKNVRSAATRPIGGDSAPCAQLGITNASPRDSRAQAIRAFLAAMATIARQYPRRAAKAIAH